MLNRTLLVVRAKQPLLDWLRSLPDPEDDSTTLESINQDASAYLLPECCDDRERDALLRKVFRAVFDDQLNGWWTDEKHWPKKRAFPVFLEWFDLEWHSVIRDLGAGPLIDDE
jgi:hypothetical protein